MPKQIVTVCNTYTLRVDSKVEVDVKFAKPGEDSQPCTPNWSSTTAGYTALTPSDLMDLVASYLVTDLMPVEAKEISEGFLRDMLRATNGMGRNDVRALWFDAVERGNRLIERYISERNSHQGQSRERPPSGSTGDEA